MYADNTSTSSRFAWLTPLTDALSSNGPWLLAVDNASATYGAPDASGHRKVTHSFLLQRLTEVLDMSGSGEQKANSFAWQSACARFSVRWSRSESNDVRLFEQRADDYFSRLELYRDGELLVAFQEPVWPHLQATSTPGQGNSLSIPLDCLDALELGALSVAGARNPDNPRKSMASAA